jgi:hypothetical protein
MTKLLSKRVGVVLYYCTRQIAAWFYPFFLLRQGENNQVAGRFAAAPFQPAGERI